jgi:type II secretion system protein I
MTSIQNQNFRTDPRLRSTDGFTLFEVLIALAVFALAVTGLAIALESIVQTALEARQRTLSRLELESRLAYNMVDPPLEGDRSLSAAENHGFNVTESAAPEELQDAQGHPLSGIYRLKISCNIGKETRSLETLIYHP